MKQLILASQSPRRKTLLAQLGYQFNTQPANIDESVYCNEKPEDYVIRLAKEKALTVFLALPEENKAQTIVLGSDTSVVINGEILGKPIDEAECITTLMRLENKQHQVLTAIAIITQDSKNSPQNYHAITAFVETQVHFKPLTVDEIKRYWNTGEPCDKAGSYAIQGIGGQFVTMINGSYSAVVGLPLYETTQLLAQAGLPSSINEGLI
ncbi:Maf family protein [Colwellia sp. 4_MG-2023]|uniref:Maf family protein n=1 Tax=unclassified Colwellia TaxID=196834 RepID=UPI0026E3D048|nr:MULTISPECIES: Maf family protein [unclassified Colwellia]MDO6506283.1 Maf family protein [Colwellia sp. 5_MG-2023]MDO6557363.1 Maf family protein [Colwellia sp. 4_MG-2023]